jgi:hypothetical protein
MKYAVQNGTAWNISNIDNTAAAFGCGGIHGEIRLIFVGASGTPAVAYHSHIPVTEAKYAVCSTGCQTGTGVTWKYQVVDQSGNVGHHLSIASDPVTKNPRVSYQDNAGFLKYATCNGTCDQATGTWAYMTVDATSNTGYWSSIAISPSGAPAISYEDQTGNNVRLAFCTDATNNCGNAATSTWSLNTVEHINGVGNYYSQLQFDAAGMAHLTYIDPSRQVLRYAIQQSAAPLGFQYFDIDTQVDDGHSSFVLTPLGSTHVAYSLTTGIKFYPFGD